MADKIGEVFVEIQGRLEKLEKEFKTAQKKAEDEGKKTGSKFANAVKNNLKSIGVAIAGAFAVTKIVQFGKSLISVASEFQDIKTRLVSLTGSQEKANEIFAEFKKIAATTPFSLKDVAKGGTTLEAFGLKAKDNIKVLTDLAAFMGVSVPEAASAMGRAYAAGAGAADIFRERGVLQLIKDAKGIDDLTKLTLPEFRQAMLETFEDTTGKIAGSTDRLSKNFSGAISNMGDAWDNFAASIATGALPIIGNLAKGISSLLEKLTPTKTELQKVNDAALTQQARFKVLSKKYLELKNNQELTTTQTELYKKVVNELQSDYGKYLKNINLEKDGYESVAKVLQKAQESLVEYAKQQAVIAASKDLYNEIAEANANIIKAENAIMKKQEDIEKINQQIANGTKSRLMNEGHIETLQSNIIGLKKVISQNEEKSNELLEEKIKLETRYSKLLQNQDQTKVDVNTNKTDVDTNKTNDIEVKQQIIADNEIIKNQIRDTNIELENQLSILEMIQERNNELPVGYQKIKNETEQIQFSFQHMEKFADSFVNFTSNAVLQLVSSNKNSFKQIETAFKNMLARMATEMAAKAAIFGIFNTITGGGFGIAKGGLSKFVFGAQGGADFTVPSGYSNDSFPVMASSGEHVKVTPAPTNNNSTVNNTNYQGSPINVSIQTNNVDESFTRNKLMPMINDLIEEDRVRFAG